MGKTMEKERLFGIEPDGAGEGTSYLHYRIKQDGGQMDLISYSAFPGINLIYMACNGKHMELPPLKKGNAIEISYCHEGQIERERGDRYTALSNKETFLSFNNPLGGRIGFPLNHYKGLFILLDMDQLEKMPIELGEHIKIDPRELVEKFSGEERIIREEDLLSDKMEDFYNIPENVKEDYIKVKLLEIFLFLKGMDRRYRPKKPDYTNQQLILAKSVNHYISENMDRHITLNQLMEIFHISGTYLKTSFKKVYGMSIYAYSRRQKMVAAAKQIKEGNDTILSIAGSFGYDNGSKFAKAFKDVMGMSPMEYRKFHHNKSLKGSDKD